jgi:hypothetical protein
MSTIMLHQGIIHLPTSQPPLLRSSEESLESGQIQLPYQVPAPNTILKKTPAMQRECQFSYATLKAWA